MENITILLLAMSRSCLHHQVRWQRVRYIGANGTDVSVDLVSTDEGVEDNARHSIEKPTPFTWRLRIKALRIDDEAQYVCFVQTTGNNNRKQDGRNVIVTGLSLVSHLLVSLSIHIGSVAS